MSSPAGWLILLPVLVWWARLLSAAARIRAKHLRTKHINKLLSRNTDAIIVADSGKKQNYFSFSTRQSRACWLVHNSWCSGSGLLQGSCLILVIAKTIPVSSHVKPCKLAGLTAGVVGCSQQLPGSEPSIAELST